MVWWLLMIICIYCTGFVIIHDFQFHSVPSLPQDSYRPYDTQPSMPAPNYEAHRWICPSVFPSGYGFAYSVTFCPLLTTIFRKAHATVFAWVCFLQYEFWFSERGFCLAMSEWWTQIIYKAAMWLAFRFTFKYLWLGVIMIINSHCSTSK